MRRSLRSLLGAALLSPVLASAQGALPLPPELRHLQQRLERPEKEGQQLRERLDALSPPDPRLHALEDARQQTDKAPSTERLSEPEPELITGLKAVERQIEALEGVSVAASLTGVLQRASAGSRDGSSAQSRLNYRGDVSVGVPAGRLNDIEGRLFVHVRLGQGTGLTLRDSLAGGTNAIAFQTQAGASDAFAILAQAWYQLTVPLPREQGQAQDREQLEITVGKMDPFQFFDQNAIADDETARFQNKVFVHNPLLDAGGDMGGDAYGFAPGLRLAYGASPDRATGWSASLGVFAAGEVAGFGRGLGRPLLLAQLDTSRRLWAGLPGNYRVYAWRNGQARDHEGRPAAHGGWGASLDQRLGDDWTGFLRYGHQLKGSPRVDRALTLGLELDGRRWGRSADGLGLATAWLHAAQSWRQAQASGAREQVCELFYRYQLNDKVQITPDLQWIRQPLAQAGSPSIRVWGVRARVGL